jgi:5-oxoprolinase (ATP-hydrolysing) subunit C
MLIVERLRGFATIQDLGRRGHMHEAVPPGGALVPELFVGANRAVRNADGDPAVEVFGELVIRAAADVELASDSVLHQLSADETLAITSEPARVAYLAVRGGIAAPVVLGGRGALPGARIGRVLRAGDRLEVAGTSACDPSGTARLISTHPIHVLAGPDHEAFVPEALAALIAAPYTIATASDRIGTRLTGAAIPRRAGYRERSRPMVRGAIEVPLDGAPIVLGPDHPTTGGYPVLAIVTERDLGSLFAIRLGGSVQFAPG